MNPHSYAVTRALGDTEIVVASKLPTIEAAERVQAVYIETDTTGADFYIETEFSEPFRKFFNDRGYTSADVSMDNGLYNQLYQQFKTE